MASTLPSPQASQVLAPPPAAEAGGTVTASGQPLPADFVFDEQGERRRFIAGLDAALRDSLLNFDHECGAAIKIQAATRGFLTRLRIAELHFFASTIQRLARGHLARRRARERLEQRAREALHSYKSACARAIQRVFRGFWSRKHRHSYWARRSYLSFVAAKGEQVRQQAQQALEEQLQRTLATENERSRQQFEKLTSSLHHLLSTKSTPGVYRPPYASHDSTALPSAFDVPLEAHLRINTLRMLRTQGYNRPLKPDASATALGNTSSVLVPSYVQPHSKLSVQASDPFDAPKEAERTRRRIAELERLDPKPFFSGGRTKLLDPAAHPVTSVHAHGVPFVEAWKRAQTERELADTSADIKQKRVSTLPFVGVTGPLGGRSFEELERHKAAATAAMLTAVKQHQQQALSVSASASASASAASPSASSSSASSSALAGLSIPIPSGTGIRSPSFKPKSMETKGQLMGHVAITSNTAKMPPASPSPGSTSVPASPSRAAAVATAGMLATSSVRRPSSSSGGALEGLGPSGSTDSQQQQQGGLGGLPLGAAAGVPKAGRRAHGPAPLPPRGAAAVVATGSVSSSVGSSANPSPQASGAATGAGIKKTPSVLSAGRDRELTSAVAALEEAEGGGLGDAILGLLPQSSSSSSSSSSSAGAAAAAGPGASAVRVPLAKRKGGEGASSGGGGGGMMIGAGLKTSSVASSLSKGGGADELASGAVYAENEDYYSGGDAGAAAGGGGGGGALGPSGSVASLSSQQGGGGGGFKRVSAIAEAGSRVLQQ